MDLSIIIVNWNSAEYLRECVLSIQANIHDMDYEVIVVDNASFDGSRELIEDEFPWVKFLQSNENLGFARANNLGFKHSSGRNLLFLNPDTFVIGQALNTMLSRLESLPDAGAMGCKLLNPDLSVQTSCIQPFPTIMNQMLDVEYLKLKFPKLKLWGIGPLVSSSEEPQTTEVISGACLMIKRHVFERVGGFCEDYFMYSEDVHLCFSVHQAGYKCYYVGDAEVVHHGGGCSIKRPENYFSAVQMRESIYQFMEKTGGKSKAAFYRLTLSAASICRLSLLGLFMPWAVLAGKYGYASGRFQKWMNICIWSLGLDRWAKKRVGV